MVNQKLKCIKELIFCFKMCMCLYLKTRNDLEFVDILNFLLKSESCQEKAFLSPEKQRYVLLIPSQTHLTQATCSLQNKSVQVYPAWSSWVPLLGMSAPCTPLSWISHPAMHLQLPGQWSIYSSEQQLPSMWEGPVPLLSILVPSVTNTVLIHIRHSINMCEYFYNVYIVFK